MTDEVEPGERVGPYVLQEVLGRGGMGEVWRAVDTEHDDRRVAVKLLRADVPAGFADRFRQEARLVGSLSHPGIVPVHRYGEHDGRLFIAMPEVPGVDLDVLLRDSGPLPPRRAVDIVTRIAEVLDAAHAEGLVHRDVKPGNVRLSGPRDTVHLLDFGIAKAAQDDGLTGTGEVIGTVAYMAPERLGPGPVDRRADVYSLAGVLHACLTARPPFDRVDAAQVWAHLTEPPPRPSDQDPALQPFDDVVAAGMAKDPEERIPDAGTLAARARAALAASESPVSPATTVAGPADPVGVENAPASPAGGDTSVADRPVEPPARGRRGLVLGAAVALVVLAAVVVAIVVASSGAGSGAGSGGGSVAGSGGGSVAEAPGAVPVVPTEKPAPAAPAPLAPGSTSTVGVGAGPFPVAAGPDGRLVLVGAEEGGTVSVVDATRGTVAATVPTGPSPSAIAVSPDSTIAWIADDDGIAVLDLRTLAVARTVSLEGTPTDLTVSPDGRSLIVALSSSGQLVALDTGTLVPGARAVTIPDPQGVALSPDGRLLAVTGTDRTLSLHDATTLAPIASVVLPVDPFQPRFSPDGRSVLVPEAGGGEALVTVDVATRRVRATTTLGGNAVQVAAAPDGRVVYAHVDGGSDGASGTLLTLDAATGQVVRRLPVPTDNSAGLAVSPDGSRVYVVDQATARLITVAVS